VTLAALLLCLPMGWVTSRLLVKPLQALVQEADAIRGSISITPPAAITRAGDRSTGGSMHA
jgi:nitrogen fixation/metabolism regulation signal transduction histidine kinase